MSKAIESSSFESYLNTNQRRAQFIIFEDNHFLILLKELYFPSSYLWLVGLSQNNHFHKFDSMGANTKQKSSRKNRQFILILRVFKLRTQHKYIKICPYPSLSDSILFIICFFNMHTI